MLLVKSIAGISGEKRLKIELEYGPTHPLLSNETETLSVVAIISSLHSRQSGGSP